MGRGHPQRPGEAQHCPHHQSSSLDFQQRLRRQHDLRWAPLQKTRGFHSYREPKDKSGGMPGQGEQKTSRIWVDSPGETPGCPAGRRVARPRAAAGGGWGGGVGHCQGPPPFPKTSALAQLAPASYGKHPLLQSTHRSKTPTPQSPHLSRAQSRRQLPHRCQGSCRSVSILIVFKTLTNFIRKHFLLHFSPPRRDRLGIEQ